MLKLTDDTTRNAVNRAYEKRCRVRALSLYPREFGVRCVNGHDHIVEIEERTSGLYGHCLLKDSGEICPAGLGKRVCYHITAALALYQAMKDGSLARAFQQVETRKILPGIAARSTVSGVPIVAPCSVVGGMTEHVEQLISRYRIRHTALPNGQTVEKCRGIRI